MCFGRTSAELRKPVVQGEKHGTELRCFPVAIYPSQPHLLTLSVVKNLLFGRERGSLKSLMLERDNKTSMASWEFKGKVKK